MSLPTREQAEKLLIEYVPDTYQKLHAHMVAAGMEAYAAKLNQDKELWYITGLLHDLDYCKFPEQHPNKSIEWFKEWQYPEELITAVADHYVDHQNLAATLPPMSAALIAIDELAGLMYAYSLMRPNKWEDMEVKSVKKKFKDKSFAAKVNRADISYGVEKLGVDLGEHIAVLVAVFQKTN
ncbi:MAG: HDIG domain-containing metalloprotein [bacterium]